MKELTTEKNIQRIKDGLNMIDRGLDIMEKNDIWGDIDENFKEWDKTTRKTDSIRYRLSATDHIKFPEKQVEAGRLFDEMAGAEEWMQRYTEESIVEMMKKLLTPEIKKILKKEGII